MGPYLARRRRRTGSRLEKSWEDLRSHNKFPKKGMVGGLGGSFSLVRKRLRREWREMQIQRDAKSRNKIPINARLRVLVLWTGW